MRHRNNLLTQTLKAQGFFEGSCHKNPKRNKNDVSDSSAGSA